MKSASGWRVKLVLIIIAALLAAACSRADRSPGGQTTLGSDVGADGGQATAGDLTVVLPPGSVTGAGKLVVSRRPLLAAPPEGIELVGDPAQVTLTGATLTGEGRVTFAVPSEIDGVSSFPVVVWEDESGGWRWLPAEWTPGEPTITAIIDHFSFGFLGKIDVGKWAKDRAEEVKNYVTGRSGVSQPSCGDEAAPRSAGVTVTSDGGDTVKWCLGKDEGKQVLRIANNRRSYTQVAYPETWTVVDGGSLGISLEAMNRTVSSGLGDITSPKGKNVRLLAGGATLTLAVPEGASGTATAEISMFAWLFSAIQLGVDVYAAVASRAGGALDDASKNSWSRIVNRLIGAERIGGYEDALHACTRALGDNVTDSPFLSTSTASAGKPLLKAAWGCVPALMQADIKDTGVRMFGLGVVLAAIGVIVGAILTAAHLIVTGVREIWDSFATIGGRSIPIYQIRVVVPPPAVEPCPANTRCFGTGSGDLDGDGKADRVGLFTRASSSAFSGGLTLRVVYGSGDFVDRDEGTVSLYAPKLLGVTDIDGDRKAEIVYLRDGGAHTRYGTILHHENGALRATVGSDGEQYELTVDSSVTSNAGVTCRDTTGDGRAELIASTFNVNASNDAYLGGTVTYQWSGVRLMKIAEQAIRFPVPGGRATSVGPPPESQPYVGLHCPGLSSG